MQLLRLDRALAARLAQEAQIALTGIEGKCNLKSYETTCFACELCDRHGSVGQYRFEDLLRANDCFVACDEEGKFMGCVSANACKDSSCLHILFVNLPLEGGLLSDLCVAPQHRGKGVAKRLIREIATLYPTMYLLVAGPQRQGGSDVARFMETRSVDLINMYTYLNFQRIASSSMGDFTLMLGNGQRFLSPEMSTG